MNRKNLTAAVLAGLAGAAGIVGSAQAVNVNPDGLGELLIYPYYTTNGGNQTALSVVNTTKDAKAVKVRFLEGQNSREVLDFNLYLSAYDVWTAAIYDDAGTPTLVTHDTSCTVPYLFLQDGGKQPFLPWALNDKMWQEDGETYDDIARASEGHFEMIEMGTMVDVLDPSGNAVNGSAASATHGASGVPENCGNLIDAWTRNPDATKNGYWIKDPFTDMTAPTGGLFGGAAIINVPAGTMYSYDAKAINGFADATQYGEADVTKMTDADPLHQEPGTILPSLDSGGRKDAYIFAADGTVTTSTGLARGVDAVSYVFMHDQIMNEYTTEAAVNAGTEWVVTFPTKQFYVHQYALNRLADYRDNGVIDGGTPSPFIAPVAPFTTVWFWNDSTKIPLAPGYITEPCEVVRLNKIWDREEGEPADAAPGDPRPPIVSPAPPDQPPNAIPFFSLCYETQVIRFAGEGAPEIEPHTDDMTEILGSANFTTIDNGALGNEFGWARLDLVDATSDVDQDGDLDPLFRAPLGGLMGLPVTGFAVQQFQNGFLGEGSSTLANYGGIFSHKGTRSAAPTAPAPTP